LSIPDVDHVLLTHVHGDHMNGLERLTFFKRFVEGKRVGLVASPDVRETIWEHRLKGPMGVLWDGVRHREMTFDDYFEFVPLSWTAETVVGPFRIRTRRTVHHVPTSALLVECQGRVLGYSSDTAFDPGLIDFLSAAHLIVHETNLGPAHTAWTDLETLPEPLRQRMRLIHYPDGFEEVGCSIALAKEGEVLAV
jgi:ribonuclease BN (tRNA processing enzyme)